MISDLARLKKLSQFTNFWHSSNTSCISITTEKRKRESWIFCAALFYFSAIILLSLLHCPCSFPCFRLTLPHANANASGQVQQCDSAKIICHSSQCVAGGQTDWLAMATRVWETKSGWKRPNLVLRISIQCGRFICLHIILHIPDPQWCCRLYFGLLFLSTLFFIFTLVPT